MITSRRGIATGLVTCSQITPLVGNIKRTPNIRDHFAFVIKERALYLTQNGLYRLSFPAHSFPRRTLSVPWLLFVIPPANTASCFTRAIIARVTWVFGRYDGKSAL